MPIDRIPVQEEYTMASQAPNERRERTRKEIKQLIEDRNTMLSQYYNLAKMAENYEADERFRIHPSR
jgi:hypothetical protein